MEIFYNNQRPNYEEIASYGPKWLGEFKEMDAVYRFAGWTLDIMAKFMEQIINNQFPQLADEKTVRLLAKIMKIDDFDIMELDDLREMVSVYYAGSGKLSKSVLQNLVKTYIGCDSEILWEGQVLRIFLSDARNVSEKLLNVLLRRMPAHIAYEITMNETVKIYEYLAIAQVYAPGLVLRSGAIEGEE